MIDAAEDRRGVRLACAIAVAVGSLYLFAATRSTLWDRDEPRFARAAVEMVESGDYLVPRFNGELRPDKPVAIYWLMSVSLRLLGTTEVAVRLWGPIATAVACFCTFLIGRLLFGARAGLWAMIILATTPMMFVDGTAVLVDGPLLAFTLLATLSFVLTVVRGARLWHWVMLALALGAAQLTKGPVGLLPVATIAGTLWFGRRVVKPGRGYALAAVAAVAVSLLIFLAWFVPADRATGGELFRRAAGTHLIGRSMRALEGHGPSGAIQYVLYLFYYPAIVGLAFFPWTLHLGGSLSALRAGRGFHPAARVLLWSWILPAPLLMTLVATKIPHYVLSIWPALALAVGAALQRSTCGELDSRDRRWMRLGVWFHAPAALLIAALLIAGPAGTGVRAIVAAGTLAALILLVPAVPAFRHQRSADYEAGARIIAISTGVFLIWLAAAIVPRVDALKPVPPLARAIRERTEAWPQRPEVAAFGFAEPTLNFYVGLPILVIEDPAGVRDWARRADPGVLVVTRTALDGLERAHGPLGLDQFATRRGFNFGKARDVELIALER